MFISEFIFKTKTTAYIWVTLVCRWFFVHEFIEVFGQIWVQALQIVFHYTWLFSFIVFGVFILLFGYRNVLAPAQPYLSHTLISIDMRTLPPPVKASYWWWTAGTSLACWSCQFHLLPFFLFRGGERWDPLVKWIKIPNNSNNNDHKKLIKNGMFPPDCVGVVVFNYAIFTGILIIFSTNKPPLIKAKHG